MGIIKCSNCGNIVRYERGQVQVFCGHCGTKQIMQVGGATNPGASPAETSAPKPVVTPAATPAAPPATPAASAETAPKVTFGGISAPQTTTPSTSASPAKGGQVESGSHITFGGIKAPTATAAPTGTSSVTFGKKPPVTFGRGGDAQGAAKSDLTPAVETPSKVIDGNRYFGPLRGGKPHGTGKMVYKNGDVYVGEWEDGERKGHGKMTYPNGDIYDGEWYEDQRWGQAHMIYGDGGEFRGEFVIDSTYTGEGKIRDVDYSGTVFVGTKIEGYLKHGKGYMTNGDVYEGEWNVCFPNGKGTMWYHDGTVWTGRFKDGERTLFGKWVKR